MPIKHDVDNVMKPLFDALVKAGVVLDAGRFGGFGLPIKADTERIKRGYSVAVGVNVIVEVADGRSVRRFALKNDVGS